MGFSTFTLNPAAITAVQWDDVVDSLFDNPSSTTIPSSLSVKNYVDSITTGSIPIGNLDVTGTADENSFLRGDGTWAVISGDISGSLSLSELTDVDIADSPVPLSGQVLTYDAGSPNKWVAANIHDSVTVVSPHSPIPNFINFDEESQLLTIDKIELDDINTTGTPSSSTFLNGDSEWVVISNQGTEVTLNGGSPNLDYLTLSAGQEINLGYIDLSTDVKNKLSSTNVDFISDVESFDSPLSTTVPSSLSVKTYVDSGRFFEEGSGGTGSTQRISSGVSSGVSSTISGGSEHKSLGDYSTVIGGRKNSATAKHSIASGKAADSHLSNSLTIGDSWIENPTDSDIGKAQSTTATLKSETTGAAAVLLNQGDGNNLIIPINMAWTFNILLTAVQTEGSPSVGEVHSWKIFGSIKNVNGDISLVGQTETVETYDSSAESWYIELLTNDTNKSLDIMVHGETNKTIRWVAKLDLAEVGWI